MAAMLLQRLRNARQLARLALACFVLALGAAVAAPVLMPQSMELVCSASGGMKLLQKAGEGEQERSAGHTLDCPLCAHAASPPPVARLALEPPQPLAHALRPVPAAHIAWLTAAPLPARGPPFVS